MPKQADFLVSAEDKIQAKDVNKAKQNTEQSINIPAGYIPIRLSTKGKLSIPEVLHFRNFNMEEIIELASIQDDEEKIFSLIKCLNQMVAEKIDCADLHEHELTELLYYIHIAFNGLEIGPYSYYIDENIEDGYIKNKKENIGEMSFKPKDLNIVNIDKKFKEPIKISKNGKAFKFRLLRIKDTLTAREYVLEKYKEEKERFVELEYAMQYNNNPNITTKLKIDTKEEKEYKQYQKNKLADFTKVLIASVLVGNEKEEFTFEKALEVVQNNELDLDFWVKYNEIVKSIDFGLEETVKFVCPKSKKSLARRFLFQAFDFLPTMESKDNSEFNVSFGD